MRHICGCGCCFWYRCVEEIIEKVEHPQAKVKDIRRQSLTGDERKGLGGTSLQRQEQTS